MKVFSTFLVLLLISVLFMGLADVNQVHAGHCSNNLVKQGPFKGYRSRCSNILKPGETMMRGQFIMSQNTATILLLQYDGNLVLYGPNKKALWDSGTSGSSVQKLRMQADGNLVLLDSSDVPEWALGTNQASVSQTELSVYSDGNVDIQSDVHGSIWNSGSANSHGHFHRSIERSRLSPYEGYDMYQGDFIRSPNQMYIFVLQGDGNIVVYGPGFNPLWSLGTAGSAVWNLRLQWSDGNVVAYNRGVAASGEFAASWHLWGILNSRPKARYLTMQNDGNLVIRDISENPLWSTGTN